MLMSPQISVPQWLMLSSDTRIKLKQIFNIPKSAGTDMQSFGGVSRLVSDGHTHKDLSVISVEKLQEYTGSQKVDFYELFQEAVEKVNKVDKETVEEARNRIVTSKLAQVKTVLSSIFSEAKELGIEAEVKEIINGYKTQADSAVGEVKGRLPEAQGDKKGAGRKKEVREGDIVAPPTE